MITYRDRTFCSESDRCDDKQCDRRLTAHDKVKAGMIDLPISYADYNAYHDCLIQKKEQEEDDGTL